MSKARASRRRVRGKQMTVLIEGRPVICTSAQSVGTYSHSAGVTGSANTRSIRFTSVRVRTVGQPRRRRRLDPFDRCNCTDIAAADAVVSRLRRRQAALGHHRTVEACLARPGRDRHL